MPENQPRPSGGSAGAATAGKATVNKTATVKAPAVGAKPTTSKAPAVATAKAPAIGTAKTAAVGRVTTKSAAVTGSATAKAGAVGKTTKLGRPVTGKQTTIRPATRKTGAIGSVTTGRRAVIAQSVARRKSSRIRNNVGILLMFIVLFLLIGPMPADNAPWQDTTWGKASKALIEANNPSVAEGQLLAGWAVEDITPAEGQPLMGYSDRKPLGASGEPLSRCYARALTVGTNKIAVTIVSVDSLLILDDLAQEIIKNRTGLRSDDIFFTATHTHSGPGGWAKGMAVEYFYGKYESMYFDRMATAISKAILASRSPDVLRPARLSFASAEAPDYVSNRIYAGLPGHPALTTISALIVSDPEKDKPRAILTSFAAHATVIRREEHRASADYPGELCRLLQKETGAEMVMFAAGAVGDARPNGSGEDYLPRMANGLIKALKPELAKAKDVKFDNIVTWNVPVDLPKTRISCGAEWSWFPFFAPHLLPAQSHISFLKLGNVALCGWPADVAGEVAAPLQAKAAKDGLNLLITSFNGNWRGYVTLPETYKTRSEYETRSVGFIGPQAGVFFSDLTTMIYKKALKPQ